MRPIVLLRLPSSLICVVTLAAMVLDLVPAIAAPTPTVGQSVDGVWSQLVPTAFALSPIEAVSSVYDSPRDRMLMFGGYNGSALVGRLFSLDLSGDPRWSEPALMGPVPSARYGNSLVYDSARDRVILFGGNASGDENQPLGDTWVLTAGAPMTFTPMTTAGSAPARYGHSAVYDPVRDRMLVLFGYDGSFRADVWQLSLSGSPTWSLLATSGTPPSARDFASVVYDPVGDRVVVVGGNALPGPTPRSDVWSLSLAGTPTWSAITPSGTAPAGRLSAAPFYDSLRQKMVILGGTDGSAALTDVVTLSLAGSPAWQTLAPGGRSPGGRWAAAAGYDAVHDRAVWSVGLGTGSHFLNDTWLLALGASPQWTEPPTANSPLPRYWANAVYDSTRDELVVYGGIDHNFGLDDLWALPMAAGSSWLSLDYDLAFRPSARAGGCMILDPHRDRLVLFGGTSANDLWAFDLSARQWTPLAATGAPPAQRIVAGSFYDDARDRMLVFGGFGLAQSAALNDTWELDFAPQPHWAQIVATGPPPARYGAAVVYDATQDRMVVYGGENQPTYYNDTWCLPLAGAPQWIKLTTGKSIPIGLGDQAFIDDPLRQRLVVYGGDGGNSFSLPYNTDTNTLDLTHNPAAWSLAPAPGPTPGYRTFPATVYDSRRDRMIVHGGRTPIKPGSLDFDSDGTTWAYTWGEIPTPTLLAFADEQTGAGTVRLTWFTPDGSGQRATAQRSTDGASWDDVAQLTSDAAGEFVLEDRVAAGGRFDYRLGVAAPGGEQFTDGHWVVIPVGVAFGFTSVGPNPSRGALTVAFALAAPGAASLDLFNVAGRRVLHRDATAPSVGAQTLELAKDGQLPSGVYLLRLVQGSRAVERKIAVVR